MTYLTLNEINTNSVYAPIGYEEEFAERIKNEILSTIKKMKVNRTFTQIKNKEHLNIIEDLLCPYFLQNYQPYIREADYSIRNYQPHYRANCSQEYLATWNCRGEYGGTFHRKDLKENLIEYFDHYWEEYQQP
tara:strand:- start:1111 stop:1509 length:399 start_codon:yes stop_codon:yes gene_type:complete